MQKKNTVIIGSSTGGFRAVGTMFSKLPMLDAGIIVVQHMLKTVNLSFKAKLTRNTGMVVKMAEDGDNVEGGMVYVAPSGFHIKIVNGSKIGLFDDGMVNVVRPSIDVTMKSLKFKRKSEENIIGVILTGMGTDGVEGIRHIKRIGGITIAQDRETSAIYGMPKAATETGDIDFTLTPKEIGDKLTELCGVIKG